MQAFMSQMGEQLSTLFGPGIVQILSALAFLVVGWLVALFLAWVVRGALRRTTIDNRIATWVMGEDKAEGFDVEILTQATVNHP